MRANCEPDSNVNEESDLQWNKHFPQRISTEDGIQIDLSPEHEEKASNSIRFNFVSDSNENEKRDPQ
jgi:hypothetical protein